MEITLVIFELSIQSSYISNSEAPAEHCRADTVQFLVTPDAAWRIKTFAVDEDVHVYSIGGPTSNTVSVVSASTERTYGDVIANRYVIKSSEGIAGLKSALQRASLTATMEVSEHGFAFWVPAGTHYRTRSTPEP